MKRVSFACVFSLFVLSFVALTGIYIGVVGVGEEEDECKAQLKNITNVIVYRGVTLYSDSLPDFLKVQIDSLLECDTLFKDMQPTIVYGTVDRGSYYTSGCNTIHLNNDHSSLLVHEYVHYLDDKLYGFNLNCSLSLFSDMIHGPNTQWGDDQGYPYCYHKNPLPNHKELMAVMAEGYCTGECGPSKKFLTNESNPIAVRQFSCLQNFLHPDRIG